MESYNEIHALQVNGVERYHGNTFAYKGIFVSSKTLNSPEGLAFSNNFCYVGGQVSSPSMVICQSSSRLLLFERE